MAEASSQPSRRSRQRRRRGSGAPSSSRGGRRLHRGPEANARSRSDRDADRKGWQRRPRFSRQHRARGSAAERAQIVLRRRRRAHGQGLVRESPARGQEQAQARERHHHPVPRSALRETRQRLRPADGRGRAWKPDQTTRSRSKRTSARPSSPRARRLHPAKRATRAPATKCRSAWLDFERQDGKSVDLAAGQGLVVGIGSAKIDRYDVKKPEEPTPLPSAAPSPRPPPLPVAPAPTHPEGDVAART